MCKFIRSSNNNAFYLNKTAINRLLNREESITMYRIVQKKKKKFHSPNASMHKTGYPRLCFIEYRLILIYNNFSLIVIAAYKI